MNMRPGPPATEQDAIAEGETNGRGVEPAMVRSDDGGPIPTFPPRALDAHGRLIPLTPEERKARSEAAVRALQAVRHRPDDDPPGTEQVMMRGIDANRAPGRKLFEGMY